MVVPAIVVGVVVILLGLLLLRWRHAAHENRSGGMSAPDENQAPSSAMPRRDTALAELRGLREALKPAEHSRIERRRPGGAGPYMGQERRRSRTKEAPRQRPREAAALSQGRPSKGGGPSDSIR